MNASSILALILDLYEQVTRLMDENKDLAAQNADLRKHLDECPQNRDGD